MLMKEAVRMMAQQLPMQKYLLQTEVLPAKIMCVGLFLPLQMAVAGLVMARQHIL
jgi:hypothetical protein